MIPAKRIFLIQTAFFGDVVMSTNLPRELHKIYPEAEIDIVLIPQTALLYLHNPHIRRSYLFDKRNPLRRIPSLLRLIIRLRPRRYDLGISVHVSFSSSLILLFSGARTRLGYPRQRFTNLTIDLPKGLPVVQRGLLLLKALAARDYDHQTEVFVPQDQAEKVAEFLSEQNLRNQGLVALAPGSVWATKRWLPEYFAEVVAALARQGISCLLIGSAADRPLCASIIDQAQAPALNLAGRFDILASAELIRRCHLLITNDSAPLHLANAVRTPVLAIFGPTVERFGCFPYREGDRVVQIDLSCRPCGKHGHQNCPQGHFRCMREISPGEVIADALEMLGEGKQE